MIGAQHRLLAHTTSNELAAIRSVELQYFLDFFNAVGLQCAFMGAYQISLLSQTPVTYNNFNYYVVCLTYWITGVLGIILGFFGLLMSIYITVFGQYLALCGPAGSVLVAINGLKEYQKMILSTFSLNILTLLISTGFQLYVYMALDLAIAASCVLMFAGSIWYRHCSIIFNSLQFKEGNDNELFRSSKSESKSEECRRRSRESWGLQWLRKDNLSTETFRVGSIGSLYDRNHPVEKKSSIFNISSNSFFAKFKSKKNTDSNLTVSNLENRARNSTLALATDSTIKAEHDASLKVEARMHSADIL